MTCPLPVRAAIPLVRAAVLQVIVTSLEREGVPVERLLERAKIPQRAIENPDILVPFAAVARLVEDAARDQGIHDLGLRMGAPISVSQLGTFGRMITRALTLHEGLETAYGVWSSYNSGVRSWLTIRGDLAELHHQFLHGDAADWGQYAAAVLMVYLTFLGAVGGRDWRPTAVSLPVRSLTGVQDIPRLANVRIDFGRPWMTVTFAAAMLSRPLPRLTGSRATATDTGWHDSMPANDAGGAVQHIVTGLLPDGYPDIRLVAEAVCMSPRTLQRRLQSEGLSFARVVARARFSEAQRMLRDPDRKVIDVALDLGYSDPAHFTRAFERWTGMPPRDFRRLIVSESSEAARA